MAKMPSDGGQSAESLAVIQRGPIAFCNGPIRSVPFQARYEQVELVRGPSRPVLESRFIGAIHRDSAGRERREEYAQEGRREAADLILISDFDARTVSVLNAATKTATLFTEWGSPPGASAPPGLWLFFGPWSLGGALEERTIEGVLCRKAHSVTPPPGPGAEAGMLGEIWVSEDIKYSVLERLRGPAREHTWRLFDVSLAEPPSSLFLVPPGYKETVRSAFGRTTPE